MRLDGESVIGLTIIPLSERLTRSTSAACSSIDRFLWMTPRPPCCAIAMARRDSVTVSIAALSERHVQPDVARQPRRYIDLCWQHRRMLRHQQHVVERERRGEVAVGGGQSEWAESSDPYESSDAVRSKAETRKADIRRPFNRHAALRGTSCISSRCRTGHGSLRPDLGFVAPHGLDHIVATGPRRTRRLRRTRRRSTCAAPANAGTRAARIVGVIERRAAPWRPARSRQRRRRHRRHRPR